MPQIDCSVYVTFRNKTDEPLVNGRPWGEASHDLGKWINLPSSIPEHGSSSFKLVETAWFTGTFGNFTYNIVAPGHGKSSFRVFQHDAYMGMNEILCFSETLASVYTLSFAARIAGGEWMQDNVPLHGHPVYVTYTLDYKREWRYQFRLLEITANSAHPVRNSRGNLISGQHTLWNSSDPSVYPDKNRGSFQPNIFAYNFGSRVAASGIMDVTVQPVSIELLGTQAILYGTTRGDGKRVVESDYFVIQDNGTGMTVQAHVIDPETSAAPFAFNAEVDWGIELRGSRHALVECAGPGVTRLELYWIASTVHPAFQPYIPVTFLRSVLVPIEVTVRATNFKFYQDMTKRVFNDYNKRYDTDSGKPWFGLSPEGGNFMQELYLLDDSSPTRTGRPGTLSTKVNCMDQAAMLELSCSLFHGSASTRWLYQSPFGYINTTHLVGVKYRGALVNVNNPFFKTDIKRAKVAINDDHRTFFKVHVFLAHLFPVTGSDGGIYDACTGPHLGTETKVEYFENVIDNETSLYEKNDKAGPGTAKTVLTGVGVTGIDNERVFMQRCTLPPLLEPFSHLVNTAVANAVPPLAHVGWAHLPIWLNATLGDAWDIRYEKVSVSETGAQALWLISNANIPTSPIHVHINVVSVLGEDRNLDMEQSAAIIKENIGSILMSTEREGIWTSGTLPGIEGVSLRYADHIAAGRIMLVAGNAVMDIMGMASYEELLPYALKLLNRTVCHLCRLPPIVPVIQRQAIRMGTTTVGEPETTTGIITVTGINTRFSLIFSVSCKIAAANAGSEGHGVLFDHHIIEELDTGEGCTVEFLFIAREVGRHRLRVCVADLETMIGANSDLEVEVVDT